MSTKVPETYPESVIQMYHQGALQIKKGLYLTGCFSSNCLNCWIVYQQHNNVLYVIRYISHSVCKILIWKVTIAVNIKVVEITEISQIVLNNSSCINVLCYFPPLHTGSSILSVCLPQIYDFHQPSLNTKLAVFLEVHPTCVFIHVSIIYKFLFCLTSAEFFFYIIRNACSHIQCMQSSVCHLWPGSR